MAGPDKQIDITTDAGMLELLRACEWVYDDGECFCPRCEGAQRDIPAIKATGGHVNDCELALAIQMLEIRIAGSQPGEVVKQPLTLDELMEKYPELRDIVARNGREVVKRHIKHLREQRMARIAKDER